MPARVVVVHDDPVFLGDTTTSLRLAGHEVAEYADPMAALDALLGVERIEVLVTRVQFAPGKPHGISLAQMARRRRPALKVIFTGRSEFEEDVRGIGEFMPLPVTVSTLVRAVERLCKPTLGGQR